MSLHICVFFFASFLKVSSNVNVLGRCNAFARRVGHRNQQFQKTLLGDEERLIEARVFCFPKYSSIGWVNTSSSHSAITLTETASFLFHLHQTKPFTCHFPLPLFSPHFFSLYTCRFISLFASTPSCLFCFYSCIAPSVRSLSALI